MNVELTLLLDLAIIIIFATGIGFLIKAIKQPSLIGYILAGLLVGPAGLGALNLHFNGFPIGLGAEQIENIRILSELGVAFLLFSIGVETDFGKIFDLRKTLAFGSILHVVLIAGSTIGLMTLMGMDLMLSLFIGMVLAFSSTTMVVKMLSDKHEINSLEGRLMVGFLLIEDIIIILMLPLVSNMAGAIDFTFVSGVVASVLVLFGAAWVLNRFLLKSVIAFASKSNELFYLTNLSVCFGFIGLAYVLDFSIAIGAFVGGLALSTLPHNLEILGNIRGLRDFFATIFFVTLGMQLSFNFTAFPLILLVILALVIYLLKPLIFFAITYLGGYGPRIAFLVGLGLAQVSEFSFILLNQGLEGGIINQSIYSLLILVIAVSMATTPYVMNNSDKLYRLVSRVAVRLRLARYFSKKPKLDALQRLPKGRLKGKRIVLVGSGALGGNIVKMLAKDNSVITIDHNPEVVANLISKGIPSVCGSAQNEEVWHKVNLAEAEMLILTTPDIETSLFLTDYAKNVNPEITIMARAHYFEGALKLYEKGADQVILPEVLASNMFLKNIASQLEENQPPGFAHNLKNEYLSYLKEKAREEKKLYKI